MALSVNQCPLAAEQLMYSQHDIKYCYFKTLSSHKLSLYTYYFDSF